MKKIVISLITFVLITNVVTSQIRMSSNGNVGIGSITGAPPNKLYVNGSTYLNGDISGNQSGALRINSGNRYIDVGPTNDSYCHFSTDRDKFYFNKKIIINTGVISSYSNQGMYLLTNQNTFVIALTTSGKVGIGTDIPYYKLDVNGDIATYGTLRIASDERLKKNVQTIADDKINKLYQLNCKTYYLNEEKLKEKYSIKPDKESTDTTGNDNFKFINNYNNLEKELRIGFIAQEFREVYPELVSEDNKGYLSIDYISLIPVLVEAIKGLKGQLDELKLEKFKLKNSEEINMSNGSILFQNTPNPFNENTIIKFYIPDGIESASISIYDMKGTQLSNIPIHLVGEGNIAINGGDLSPGMYMYTLITNNQVIDTKRMILTD